MTEKPADFPGFEDFMNGVFQRRFGRGYDPKDSSNKCNKKLCFVSTDQQILADVLFELMERVDGWAAKFSTRDRSGMYLGRAFFTDEETVGTLWRTFKGRPDLFCSVQDDDWVGRFR